MIKKFFIKKPCFLCIYYRVIEENVGYCKLFDDLKIARESNALCGKEGKWFVKKESINKIEYNTDK
jgi:hypothetical protein